MNRESTIKIATPEAENSPRREPAPPQNVIERTASGGDPKKSWINFRFMEDSHEGTRH